MLKDAGGPMAAPHPGFQIPRLVPQAWHFPKSKLGQLKSKVNASLDQGSWISTYDAVMGLLWSHITAAMISVLQPDTTTTTTTLVHAANTRTLWTLIGFGSAVVQGRAGPFPIRDIISTHENLPDITSAVRASIRQLTLPYLHGMLEWITGQEYQRYLETNVNLFLGADLGASVGRAFQPMESMPLALGCLMHCAGRVPHFEVFALLSKPCQFQG